MSDPIHHRRRTDARCAGFSLVEVLIALLVLAVSTLALTGSVVTSKKTQQHMVEVNEGAKVANAVLESFRKMPYLVLQDGLPSGSYRLQDLGTVYDDDLVEYDLLDSGLSYQLRSALKEMRLDETIVVEQGVDAMRVTVQIAKDSDGSEVARMTTFIAQNGINFR